MSLRKIILKISVEDLVSLDDLDGFEHFWQYPREEEAVPEEWGRIKTDDFDFRFYAVVKQLPE